MPQDQIDEPVVDCYAHAEFCRRSAVIEPNVTLRVGFLDVEQRWLRLAENIDLYVFQSDLMDLLDRPQAAQACLEHALRLKVDQENSDRNTNIPDQKWWENLADMAGIETGRGDHVLLHVTQARGRNGSSVGCSRTGVLGILPSTSDRAGGLKLR